MANDYSEITITGDNDPLKSSIDSAVGMFKGFATKVKESISSITDIHSFDELWSKMRHGIDLFEETQRGLNKLEYQLKATGNSAGFYMDQLKFMNTEMQKVTKYSEDAINAAQSALLKYDKVRMTSRGNIFQEALKGAADLAAALGDDLTSSVHDVGKALQDPVEGLDILESKGIEITKSQRRLVEALMRTGQGALAQKVILKLLADVYGGAAEKEAGTFTARLEKLNESFDQTWKKIGGFVTPYLNKFITVVEGVNRVLDYYSGKVTDWFESLLNGVNSSGPSIEDWFKTFAEWSVKAFAIGEAAFTEWQSLLVGGLVEVTKYTLDAFKKMSTIVLAWVEQLRPVWDIVAKTGESAWDSLKESLKPAFQYMIDLGGWLVDSFQKVFDSLLASWKMTLGAMKEMSVHAFRDIMNFKNPIGNLDKVFEMYKMGMGAVMPKFGGAPGMKLPVVPGVGGMGDKAKDALQGFWDRFKEGAKDAWKNVDKDLEPFLKKYGESVAKNSGSFKEFFEKILKIANGDEYTNVMGAFRDPSFKGKKDDGEGKTSLEDLHELNRRITAAAFKSPEVRELEKQTNAILQGNTLLKDIVGNTKDGKQKKPHETFWEKNKNRVEAWAPY